VRSFFGIGEGVEFVTEFEKALREASEFAAGLVIVQLTAKQLQKMLGSGDGVVNGGDVGLNGGGGCAKREFRKWRAVGWWCLGARGGIRVAGPAV